MRIFKREFGSRKPGRQEALRKTAQPVGSRDHRKLGAEFQDLGGEDVDVMPGHQGVHLIQVAVTPNHVESIGSDRPRRSQNGKYFHRSICHFSTGYLTVPGKQMYRFS